MKSLFLALSLFSTLILSAQDTVHNLVFEGSGIRGIAFAGAIRELESRDLLDSVKRVGGTSAGSITAMLIALGYTSEEISVIVNSTSYRRFNDGGFFLFGGISRLQKYYGWYRGRKLEKWISGLIAHKTGNDEISFADLRARGYKELYVTGTSLNRQRLIIFSHENFPNMKVRDAVRISSSIPLYFEAVYLDSEGNIIDIKEKEKATDIMVDGGMTGNFPIRMFDSTRYFNDSQINRYMVNPYTVGFRIDREEQIRYDADSMGIAPMPVNDIKQYLSAFYNIVIENLNRQQLGPEDWERTVSISDGTVQPRIRKLSRAEVETLVNNGTAATSKYLQKKANRF